MLLFFDKFAHETFGHTANEFFEKLKFWKAIKSQKEHKIRHNDTYTEFNKHLKHSTPMYHRAKDIAQSTGEH